MNSILCICHILSAAINIGATKDDIMGVCLSSAKDREVAKEHSIKNIQMISCRMWTRTLLLDEKHEVYLTKGVFQKLSPVVVRGREGTT